MKQSGDHPIFAAILLSSSMALMSFVDNLVRVVSDDITVWQFHFLRACFALPLIAVAAYFTSGQTLRQRMPFWVALRAIVMAISMLFFFASIPILPMAQATAGLFTAPLFVLVFSALFLNEPVGPRRIGAVLFGFLGVLIILQPFRADVNFSAMLPVVAGAFYAVGVVITRQRCREESHLALLFANFFAFGLMGLLGLTALMVFPPSALQIADAPFIFTPWETPPLWVVVTMAFLAIGAALGVAGLTRAYQLAESSYLTLFDYTHVIGACLFAYLLWDEVPPPESILGVIMIVSAGLYLAWRNMHEGATA